MAKTGWTRSLKPPTKAQQTVVVQTYLLKFSLFWYRLGVINHNKIEKKNQKAPIFYEAKEVFVF